MSARTRKVLNLLLGLTVAFLGGAALLLVSRFVSVGQDRSDEAVGIITRYGLPIPFAFDAPGYAWTDFNGLAALADYLIWTALVLIVFRFIKSVK